MVELDSWSLLLLPGSIGTPNIPEIVFQLLELLPSHDELTPSISVQQYPS